MEVTIKDYPQHKTSVINLVDGILTENPGVFEDELSAFNQLAAELFAATTQEGNFVITDGPKDQGVDFYTQMDSSYEVFQCKFKEFETIRKEENPLKFDQKCVRDIHNAYNYLTSPSAPTIAKDSVKQLRAKIKSEEYSELSFNLCIFGELTSDAEQKFQNLKKELESEKVKFNLYDWQHILRQILLRTQPQKKIDFTFRVYKEQISYGSDWCYFLARAKDFYNLFENDGWPIFDLNVRSELRNSPINKRIFSSLTRHKSMRFFHHFNNGILMFCENYKRKGKNESVEVKNLQIINGCQTVRSIHRAYLDISSYAEKKKSFDEECLVQVKIISKNKNTEPLIDEIIVATNNQNPMSPRNLKANTQIQKNIKSLFDSLPNKWFYQRKDGEFDSLKRLPKIGRFKFRITDYKSGNIYRYIDNKDLAKSWLSFIGLSYRVMLTKHEHYFEEDELYPYIFNSYPKRELWYDFSNTEIEFKEKEEYFIFGRTPTAEEYLLSYLIWQFIKQYSVSSTAAKREGLERGVKKGKLNKNVEGIITNTKEDQAKYLVEDTKFMVNQMINNSKPVILEMFSFIWALKYDHGYEAARKVLKNPTFKELASRPDFSSYIKTMNKATDNILYSTYEFVKYVLHHLYAEIRGDYIAASNRKRYLATTSFIQSFKKKIKELNEADYFISYSAKWKEMGKSFVDSLPNL